MSSQPPPSPYRNPSGAVRDYAPRLLVIFAIAAGIGVGTCGVTLIGVRDPWDLRLVEAGSILFGVGLLGLVITVAFMVVRAIVNSFRRPGQ